MNKQIVLFLSLFSVLLLVSIYYITSPISEVVVNKNGYLIEERAERDAYIETLKKEQSTIIASSSSTESAKKVALVSINAVKSIIDKQIKIEGDLAQLGYDSVVKFDNKSIKIIVASTIDSKEVAAPLLAKAKESVDASYSLELSFKLH